MAKEVRDDQKIAIDQFINCHFLGLLTDTGINCQDDTDDEYESAIDYAIQQLENLK